MVDCTEVLEHFGLIDKDTSELIDKDITGISTFDSKNIEYVGKFIAIDLAKGIGRAIVDFDPAYPRAVLRIKTDFPNE